MKEKPKTIGLALGGGAARGWAHVGVIRAFQKAGIPIDAVAGTSIGALVGGFYASGNMEILETMAKTMQWKTALEYMDLSLPRHGLVKGEKIFSFLTQSLKRKRIQNLGVPFCAVATELNRGREVRVRKGLLSEAIRASISIPGIFHPIKKEGKWLVDGGLVNPVPVSAARAMGVDCVVAVDVNYHMLSHFENGERGALPKNSKKKNRSWSEELKRHYEETSNGLKTKLKGWALGSKPMIYDVIGWSVLIMEEEITQKNLISDPADFLIRPNLGPIRAFDFHRAQEMIEEGERAAQKTIRALREKGA